MKRIATLGQKLVLLLIALLLCRAAVAALQLGESCKNRCERARRRAMALGPTHGAWCELAALLLYALARTSLTCTVKWSGRSQRLYALVNEARTSPC